MRIKYLNYIMRPGVYLLIFLLLSVHFASAQKFHVDKTIHIGYHPTIETIMILRALSPDDYFLKRFPDTFKGRPMMYIARKHFAKYKNHPAVAETQRMLELTQDIGGTLFQGALYAEELPGTNLIHEPLTDFWKQHRAELVEYMKVLVTFYKEAGVSSFFKEQQYFYKGAVKEASLYIDSRVTVEMEKYFGKEQEGYNMYVLPMCPYGWGFSLTTPGEKSTIQHTIVAPAGNVKWDETAKEHKEFGFGGKEAKAHYRAIVAHELTHSFITDVISAEPFKTMINSYDSLYTPMLDTVMQEEGYGDWWGFVNEHLVRTGHVRVLQLIDKTEASELRQEDVIDAGFVLEPDAEELMKVYEQNRGKYKTIDDFLPELIQQFGTFNRQYIDNKLAAIKKGP